MEREEIEQRVEEIFERSDQRIHAVYTKILELIHIEEQIDE